MKKETGEEVVQIISEAVVDQAEDNIFTVYAEKFKQFRINVKARKLIAKELNIDEQNALKWKTVQDIFSFLDSSNFAKEHPKEAVGALKLVAAILGAFYPAIALITTAIIALPQKEAAMLMEWLGKPTPEHIAYKYAEKKAKNAKA